MLNRKDLRKNMINNIFNKQKAFRQKKRNKKLKVLSKNSIRSKKK